MAKITTYDVAKWARIENINPGQISEQEFEFIFIKSVGSSD